MEMMIKRDIEGETSERNSYKHPGYGLGIKEDGSEELRGVLKEVIIGIDW